MTTNPILLKRRREADAAAFLRRRAAVAGRPPARSGRWSPRQLDPADVPRVDEGARRWHRAVIGRELARVVWVDSPSRLGSFAARWHRQRHRAPAARWRWRLRLLVRVLVPVVLLPFLVAPPVLAWFLAEPWIGGTDAVLLTMTLFAMGGWAVCVVSYAAALHGLDAVVPWIWWTDDARVDLDRLRPLALTGVPDELVRGDDEGWCPSVLQTVPGVLTPVPPAGLRQHDGSQNLLYGRSYRCGVRFPVMPAPGRVARTSLVALSWLRGRGELVLDPRVDDVVAGWEALTAGPYGVVVYPDLVVVVRPPTEVSLEQVPDGTLRLHDDEGPAVRWADGTVQYVLRGTEVPADLFLRRWDVAQIRAEPNGELRRLAIERLGWDRFIELSGLRPIARAPDPANEGVELELHAVPGVDHRILLMRNGSPDRSGAVRRYAEGVPASITDPVAAAAWQYGVPVEVYRTLQRRT